jgi:hypothetical protein
MGSLPSDALLELDPTNSSPPPLSSRLIIPATLYYGSLTHTTRCLIDTGADDNAICEALATRLNLPLVALLSPMVIGLASDSKNNDVRITHKTTPLQLHIGKHVETISFFVVPNLSLPIFLSDTWLVKHNPDIDWIDKRVTLKSDFCLAECCTSPVVVYSISSSKHALLTNNGVPYMPPTSNDDSKDESTCLKYDEQF